MLDTPTLSPFLILAGLSVGLGAGSISVPALLGLAVVFFGIVALVLWKIVPLGCFLLAFFERLLSRLRIGGRPFFVTVADKFRLTVEEFAHIRDRQSLLALFAQSLVIRLAKYVSVFALFYGLLKSRGFSLADLSFSKFILGLSGRRPSAGLNENETLACTYCRVFLESRLETAAVKVPFTLEHIAPNPAWPRAAFEH